ncbi:hypothetical protein GCM10020254_37660 [Streptomyces goshikiensis]
MAHPYTQNTSASEKVNTAHGKWITEYSACRQALPLFSTAPPHRGERPRLDGPDRLRIRHLHAQQPAHPGPLQVTEAAAHREYAGQHRDPEEGDQQPGAEADPRDGEREVHRAQRQPEHQVPELPPGPPRHRRPQHPADTRPVRHDPAPSFHDPVHPPTLAAAGPTNHPARRRPHPGDNPTPIAPAA